MAEKITITQADIGTIEVREPTERELLTAKAAPLYAEADEVRAEIRPLEEKLQGILERIAKIEEPIRLKKLAK